MILFINACVREGSRTKRLADHVLAGMEDKEIREVRVWEAPYYDLSFPSMLKQYLEQICVVGLTFFYNEQDQPETLCRAKKLYYVTTAGGPIISDAYGYGYVRELVQTFFGIPETTQVKAEMLDIIGYDAEAILAETIRTYDEG